MKKIISVLCIILLCGCESKDVRNSRSVNSKTLFILNDITSMKGKISSIVYKHYNMIDEDKDTLSFITGVKYNQEGSISEVLNNNKWLRISTKYDDNNNEIESFFTDDNGNMFKQTFVYDNNGNNIEDITDSRSRKFEYNDKGNIIVEKVYNNKELSSISKYTYNQVNDIVEVNIFNADNSFKSKHIYKYDDKRNVIADTYFDSPDHQESVRNYKYSNFDSNGNWIKCIESGKSFDFIEREISYH